MQRVSKDAFFILKRLIKTKKMPLKYSEDALDQLLTLNYIKRKFVQSEELRCFVEDDDIPYIPTEDGKAYLDQETAHKREFIIGSVIVPIVVSFFTAFFTTVATLALKGL